jgi:hypothetical protein
MMRLKWRGYNAAADGCLRRHWLPPEDGDDDGVPESEGLWSDEFEAAPS